MAAESKLTPEAAARFVLGLGHGWTKEDVKRAYRRLALVFHPDKNPGKNVEEATKRFQAIARAKDLLLGMHGRPESGLAASARRESSAPPSRGGRSQAPPPPPPPFPGSTRRARPPAHKLIAMWMCGACQMRDLGSSPGSVSSCGVPCGRSTPKTKCFCGHDFEEHELCVEKNSKTGEPLRKLRCTRDNCACADFSYVPAGALCSCGHGPSNHDEKAFHGCKVSGCTCQTFHHAGACACRHSWACHRTELRPAAPESSKTPQEGTSGIRPGKVPWWRGGGATEDADDSPRSDSSSTRSESPPSPPVSRQRTRPSSAKPADRSTPSTPSSARSGAKAGDGQRAPPPPPQPPPPQPPPFPSAFPSRSTVKERPRSAGSRNESPGARLDVRGRPMSPAPRYDGGPPPVPPPVRRRTPSVPPKGPTPSAPPAQAPPKAAAQPAAAPEAPSSPASGPRARPSSAPPSRSKSEAPEVQAVPIHRSATPRGGRPAGSFGLHRRPVPPPLRPPTIGQSPYGTPVCTPAAAAGAPVGLRRPPRPSADPPTPATAAPAPAPAPAASEGNKQGPASAEWKCKDEEPGKAWEEEEEDEADEPSSIEPDAEPDSEPSESQAMPQASHSETHTSSAPSLGRRPSKSKMKSSASSASIGRPSQSAADIAASAAAAAAAATVADGRPWWERLHNSSKVHRTVQNSIRRPTVESFMPREQSSDLPRSPRRSQSKEAPHKSAAEVLSAAAAESAKYAAAQPTRSTSRPSSAQRSHSASRLPPTQPVQKLRTDEPLASLMQKLHEQDSFIYDDEGPSFIKEPDGPSFFGVDSDEEGAPGPSLRRADGNWAQETLQRLGELQRSHERHKSMES